MRGGREGGLRRHAEEESQPESGSGNGRGEVRAEHNKHSKDTDAEA